LHVADGEIALNALSVGEGDLTAGGAAELAGVACAIVQDDGVWAGWGGQEE